MCQKYYSVSFVWETLKWKQEFGNNQNLHYQGKMAQYQDERGFTKTEMEVWNPNQEGANFQATGR